MVKEEKEARVFNRLPRDFFLKKREVEKNNDSLKELCDFNWSKEVLEGERKIVVKEAK